ncbi:MAG: EF-P lysine aminoacylase EpmA [Thiotrichaceae bacterium]
MRQLIIQRARILYDIRAFFYQRDVLEVETPALSQAGNTDPFIDSFQVEAEGGTRYLHTSPEYPMKRLLAAGSGDIYQVCKVWRASEVGSRHNPEFTMLEWYRLGFTYHQLMKEVEALLQSILTSAHENSRFVSYRELFLEVLGFDPHIANNSELQSSMAQQQLDVMGELDHTAMLDVLMTHCIEPTFAKDRLTFVYDYPAEQKALAILSDDESPVAQRFEVYWGAVELGNGYQEQTDADMNASILQSDSNKREAKGMTNIPIDERFIAALRQGLPMCSGVAIGLDRLLMCQLNKKNLQEVISFPWTMA